MNKWIRLKDRLLNLVNMEDIYIKTLDVAEDGYPYELHAGYLMASEGGVAEYVFITRCKTKNEAEEKLAVLALFLESDTNVFNALNWTI